MIRSPRTGSPGLLLAAAVLAVAGPLAAEDQGANVSARTAEFARIVCQHGGRYGGDVTPPGLSADLAKAQIGPGDVSLYRMRLQNDGRAYVRDGVMVLEKDCR
ncbi:MAG: hypothetical protein AAF667_11490 [Pseudomonadota bacterium]